MLQVEYNTIIYLFIYWRLILLAQLTAQGHLDQGFSLDQISLKLNTKQNMHIIYKRKTYKHNAKVSPFGIALVKNGK